MKNVNKSEFFETLRENGYAFEEIGINFSKADNRVWGVILSPGEKNLMVFYYKNRKFLGDQGFDLIADKRNYYNISPDEFFDSVDQVLTGGKINYE